ncbi:glycosyltransferase family 4 protein [Patescibacteria group bacterium]
MKIVFFDINRLSYEGGAENYISDVANEMHRQGHEVYYIGDYRWLLNIYISLGALIGACSWSEAKKARSHLRKQPTLRPIDRKKIKPWQLTSACFMPGSKKRRQTKELLESADMIFVKNEVFEMWALNMLTRRVSKSLILFSSPEYPDAKTFRARLHNFFYTGWIYRRLLSDYKNLIVSNDLDKKFLLRKMRRPTQQIKKVPYGLKDEDFCPIRTSGSPDKFRVLFAGRLEEQKGVDFLIETIYNLMSTSNFEKLSFTIAGEGHYRHDLEKLARRYSQVKLIGLVPKEEMNQLYNSHDLVVITSRWETFCYTCLEAQSCGIPVVSFDVSGPNEMILDRKTGRLIKPGDVNSFAQAIKGFYNLNFTDQDKFVQIKEAAHRHMQDNFSLAKVVADLLEISKD